MTQRKCDLLGRVNSPNLSNYIRINRNFAQKSGKQKVRRFGSSWQTKPSQLYVHRNFVNRNFAKKVRRKKCDPLGPVDKPNLHHFISINRNFAQKSATQKVWPFGSSWQSKPSTLLLKEIFLKKVRRMVWQL